ncbi:uncharacterized protein [Drosophila pseudoobscura]|uniref:Uncharacterized protein n=1 Tax=Drosophila pseudoobscura pseudoobscura TaxID=46245 RepID=A0A6I8UR71_DROPS|nr:uncharacterized protein LOC4802513 [Drosophila pseudoobscura]
MTVYKQYSRAKPYLPKDPKKHNLGHQSFTPSYEKDAPKMSLLMCWHYGRKWLEESKEFHEKIARKERGFIQPGIEGWLQKRMTAAMRRANNLDPIQKKPKWG